MYVVMVMVLLLLIDSRLTGIVVDVVGIVVSGTIISH